MRFPPALALVLLVSAACGAPVPPPVDPASERALLEAADARYTEVMNAGDVEGILALYASDATRWSPAGPATTGRDAMRAFAEGVAATPGFGFTVRPLRLEVAAGGELGYTVNELDLTTTGPDGQPVVQRLRDVHVWRKGADGAWLIVEDVWQVLP